MYINFLVNFLFSVVMLVSLRWEPSVWGSSQHPTSFTKMSMKILFSFLKSKKNGFFFSLQDIFEGIFIFAATICLGLSSLVCKSTLYSNLPSVFFYVKLVLQISQGRLPFTIDQLLEYCLKPCRHSTPVNSGRLL